MFSWHICGSFDFMVPLEILQLHYKRETNDNFAILETCAVLLSSSKLASDCLPALLHHISDYALCLIAFCGDEIQ